MWDITSISEVTLIGLGSVAVLGGWVAIEFYRSHQSFKARERLFHSLCERVRKGQPVQSHELTELLPKDQAAIRALELSKQNMSANRRYEEVAVHSA